MKKHLLFLGMILFCLLLPNNEIKALYGYVGDCSTFIALNNCTYHVSSCNNGSAPGTCVTSTTSVPFLGNIGNISSLTMLRMSQNTFESGGDDVISGTFYYSVHLQGAAPGAFTLLNLPMVSAGPPEMREAVPNLDLTSSLPDDDYTLTIYYGSIVQPNGGGPLVPITLDNGGNYYSIDFTLITGPLPVELVDFQAKENGDAIALDWATGAELDHSHFEIEKSVDGRNWEFIGSIDGQGNNNEGDFYQYIDERVVNGEQFYRLKSVALDGTYEYSEVVSVRINNAGTVQVYPNPVRDVLSIRQTEDADLKVEIFNALGQKVAERVADTIQFDINLNGLKQGVYFVNIYSQNQLIKSERLLKKN